MISIQKGKQSAKYLSLIGSSQSERLSIDDIKWPILSSSVSWNTAINLILSDISNQNDKNMLSWHIYLHNNVHHDSTIDFLATKSSIALFQSIPPSFLMETRKKSLLVGIILAEFTELRDMDYMASHTRIVMPYNHSQYYPFAVYLK